MRPVRDHHPLLFGLFPVLFAAAHNTHVLVLDRAVFGSALLVAGVTALVVRRVLRLVLKRPLQAGLCASLALLSVSSYGMVGAWVFGPSAPQLGTSPERISPLLWLGLLGCLCYLATRIRGDLRRPTQFANAVACVLCASSVWQIACATHRVRTRPELPAGLRKATNVDPREAATQPDIYYIILDRYGSAAALRESLHVDNQEFVGTLRRAGFYVADGSYANYGFTVLSLASSLHMQYLDGKALARGGDPRDLHPIFEMLQDYPVWRFLRARGYRFIHVGSWHDPLRANTHADLSLNWASRPNTEFTRLLWGQTLPGALVADARPEGEDYTTVLAALAGWAGLDGLRLASYHHTPYQFEQLVRLSHASGPKFVFAHLMVTHPPYVFARDGSLLRLYQVKQMGEAASYAESLEFCNRSLRKVLPQLLAGSRVPPIIILQADEGPYPERLAGDEGRGLGPEATDAELRLKYGILNAYYVPAPMRARLYPTITPVNSFRLLFGTCFGADLPLLPDECYGHKHRRLDTLSLIPRDRLAHPRPFTLRLGAGGG